MAETNRTERRLLDSIRRAKTGTDAEAEAQTPNAEKAADKPAAASAPRTRRAAGGGKTNQAAAATKNTASKPGQSHRAPGTHLAGSYQYSRRIWPD